MATARAPSSTLEVDLEVCEMDCLIDVAYHIHTADLHRLADHMPKPVPMRKRRRDEDLRRTLISYWAYPKCRAYLQEFIFQVGREVRAATRNRQSVKKMLESGFEPTTILYQAHLAGRDPAKVLAQMPAAARRRLLERQEVVREFVNTLRRARDEKIAEGARASQTAVVRVAERRTRELKEQLDRIKQKHQRAEKTVSTMAATIQGKQLETQQAIENERIRADALEAENRRLRGLLDAIKEQQTRAATDAREKSHHALSGALAGMSVVVVGDENRATAYKEIVGGFGGDFSFVSGFAEPRRVEEALSGADMCVLVTAYASHKVSGRVTASGKPVVHVNVAGERAMREALGKFVFDLLLNEEGSA